MEKERLAELPDELLLKIFSLLPMFQESVVTPLISKRWSPWKLAPEVMLDDKLSESFATLMSTFVYGSMLSNDAQTLERLYLKLSESYSASDINFCVQVAVYRYVKELRIDLFGKTLELPCCLSTCRTLNDLILHELRIEVVPAWFCLPSLKTLHLSSVKFSGNKAVASLLKSCLVLECLVLANVKISNIDVPTLRNLSIKRSIDNSKGKRNLSSKKSTGNSNSEGKREKLTYVEENHRFVIKAPSLIYLNFEDTLSNSLMFEPMPEVIKANIEVICHQSENFIGSLPSIQHLSLCSLTSQTPYPKCASFSSLEHLELCTCSAGWADLLTCMLNDAPNLRSLKLKSKHKANYNDPMNHWKEPMVVAECLSKHLEILEWRQYEGTEQERKVAAYIVANATCLKMATFSTRCRNKHHTMLRKLNLMDKGSETCQLVFD